MDLQYHRGLVQTIPLLVAAHDCPGHIFTGAAWIGSHGKLQVFSQEVLGIDLTFFQGAKELHGRYDRDSDRFYVNQEAEVSMDWVIWHEAFHAMKEHEPELYTDLLCHAEKTEMFSKQMMDDYRREVKRPCMSDGEVAEELLANAFADRKTGRGQERRILAPAPALAHPVRRRRMLQDMAKANPTLVQRLAAFTQRILQNARRLLHLQDSKDIRELQEKYPGVRLTDRQFRDFSERITENLCSLRDSKNQPMFISKGYRILAADGKVPEDSLRRLPKYKHSPFRHAPQKQKKFDQRAAQELLRRYPQDAVAWAVQELSPLGKRMGQYGKRLVQETAKIAER